MPERGKRKPLGRALQEVLGAEGADTPPREEQGPGAGLLAHPARAALFQLLLDRPLSNVSQAARALRTTPPSARWHLAVLEEAGVVQTRREGRSLVASVSGTAEGAHARPLAVLRLPHSLQVLHAVTGAPGITVGDAARAGQTTPQSAIRTIRALASVSFVETVRDGRYVRLYPGDGVRKLIDERSEGLPAQARRVAGALEDAGESVAVHRRARGEVTLAVGRRGSRREFALRSDAPFRPLPPP